MIVLLQSMRKMSTVSKKLVILIIGVSSLITLFLTAFQLFLDYRVQRAGIDEMVDRVGIFFPPLAASVWSFDDRQITLSLQALVNLPHIERATVTITDGNSSWTAQSGQSRQQVVRSFPLTYESRGRTTTIATIDIAAGLDSLFEALLWQGAAILLGNAIKALLVAGVIYAATRRLVTTRIEELARRVSGLVPQLAPDDCITPIDDAPAGPAKGDEIDAVRWAFDGMAERLKLLVTDLAARNLQLAAENRERQRAEAELRDAAAQLSIAMVEVERFAYVAAHDLQEPIRTIVSFSQLLERRCGDALTEQGHEYLDFVIKEALRLSQLVTDLLNYSRCRGQSFAPDRVDCAQTLAQVIGSLHERIGEIGADITAGPLPEVRGDGGQLNQLFQNLLANALKFARPDVAPAVHIEAERAEDGWLFKVSDNGIGIEPQYADYIFEVFRRLHTRDSFPGTGIGLAICKRVVENHGGRIWVTSTPGQGATFHFTLPAWEQA